MSAMELKHEWRDRKLYINDLHVGTLKQTSPQWPAKGCWERFHYQGSFIDFDMEDKSINARCAEIAKRWYMAYVSNHKDSLRELIADESIQVIWYGDMERAKESGMDAGCCGRVLARMSKLPKSKRWVLEFDDNALQPLCEDLDIAMQEAIPYVIDSYKRLYNEPYKR